MHIHDASCEKLPRDPGKGTAGRDYTNNKLTRTTLSRRIIHHEGYVRARPDSATRAYLRRAVRLPPRPDMAVLHINRVKL